MSETETRRESWAKRKQQFLKKKVHYPCMMELSLCWETVAFAQHSEPTAENAPPPPHTHTTSDEMLYYSRIPGLFPAHHMVQQKLFRGRGLVRILKGRKDTCIAVHSSTFSSTVTSIQYQLNTCISGSTMTGEDQN